MQLIQELFDGCGGEITLEPKLYKAPLVISRPCRINGNGAVIVCGDSECVRIDSDSAELTNLKIERTSSASGLPPILICREDTWLDGVILRGDMVRGNVTTAVSQYPDRVDLGVIPANSRKTFKFSLCVSENTVVENQIDGVSINPEMLSVGENELTVGVEPLRDETVIFGRIVFRFDSGVGKEVCLSAVSSKFAEENSEKVELHFPRSAAAISNRDENRSVEAAPAAVISPTASNENSKTLQRGQRLAFAKDVKSLKLQFTAENIEKAMDIDGYAFMLHENGKTLIDEDMIFWGNKNSPENSVQIAGEGTAEHFSVDLGGVPSEIKKITFCWSIYGDNADECFVHVKSPKLRIIIDDTDEYVFRMDGLMREKTIAAAEIYRYGDSWKINCIGSGYHSGLRRLCEDYGVDIED